MIKLFRNIRKNLLSKGKTGIYLKYAIGEIVLVVIGILIALQVNNWNETRLGQKKIRQYAKSLIEDLKSDIAMLEVSQFQAEKKYKSIDSLRNYMRQTPIQELSNTTLLVLCNDIMYRPYKWNRSTLNELKNSGGLSYITNDSLLKKLVAYESFSYHLDEDFEFDKSNSDKADHMLKSVLDLNFPYFMEIILQDNDQPFKYIFTTEVYNLSKANDLKLINYDKELIQRYINTFVLIQRQYQIRGYNEMPDIMQDAKELIQLLKNEYQL